MPEDILLLREHPLELGERPVCSETTSQTLPCAGGEPKGNSLNLCILHCGVNVKIILVHIFVK